MSTNLVQSQFPFVPPLTPMPEAKMTLHVVGKYKIVAKESGIAVRFGDEWASLVPGDMLKLTAQPTGYSVMCDAGEGIVEKVWFGTFSEIPARLFTSIHTGEKTYAALLSTLRREYGKKFKGDESVVFLQYRRLSLY